MILMMQELEFKGHGNILSVTTFCPLFVVSIAMLEWNYIYEYYKNMRFMTEFTKVYNYN